MRVVINQKSYEFHGSPSILTALRQIGIDVPTLCHDERLEPVGDCRMCLVEVEGSSHPVASCVTQLTEGMKISTHSTALEDERRALLQMWAQHYPVEAVQESPNKIFHQYLRNYHVVSECIGAEDPELRDESHPDIRVDMARCIDCYRCVRICREVQGQFVWEVLNRGDRTRIVPNSQTTLLASTCVSCGACVDSCPTGALEDQSVIILGSPTAWTKTTCPYCGVGCEMEVGTREQRIVQIKPSLDAAVNKGHLCVKGRYGFEFVYATDRVTEPMIRESGVWKPVSWESAISFVTTRLRDIEAKHGPDSIGVLGSARATNEENYLAQKFARVVLKTNNVDCCARVCHAPTASAMKLMLGTGAATNSFDDIERASTILVCGTNTTENHPVIGARIRQAVLNGARLVVIDPRRIELAEHADIHLQLKPGTNIPLLNAIACVIVEEGLVDQAFVESRVDDWDQFVEFIRRFTPESVASICEVEPRLIRQAARLYAVNKPSLTVHGLGVTEHVQGTEGVMCLVNLALLTGNLGKEGAGLNPLRGQNNVQGSAHMGCEPNNLTGYVGIDTARKRFEGIWGKPLPTQPGKNLLQMMDAAEAGTLKGLWAIGYDIFATNANAEATARALRALDLVIVQDMFLNETAREFGHVFLPCTSSFEKDGTFMNAERRVQRVRKAIEPRGTARPDWEIICQVAAAMGHGEDFSFHSAEEIWNEVREVWEAGRGISYARIDQAGLQWPCPADDHPGTTILHTNGFPLGERVGLRSVEFRPTSETTTPEFPFLLITGRTLHHFNAGTMTMRTNGAALRPRDVLDIAPHDAARLGLADGVPVRLRSRYGTAVIRLHQNESVQSGNLFATFHTAEVFLNQVTSPLRDKYTDTPEYKVTAVRIEVE